MTEPETDTEPDTDAVTSARLKQSTLTRLKKYSKYGESVDAIINHILDQLEEVTIPETELEKKYKLQSLVLGEDNEHTRATKEQLNRLREKKRLEGK